MAEEAEGAPQQGSGERDTVSAVANWPGLIGLAAVPCPGGVPGASTTGLPAFAALQEIERRCSKSCNVAPWTASRRCSGGSALSPQEDRLAPIPSHHPGHPITQAAEVFLKLLTFHHAAP